MDKITNEVRIAVVAVVAIAVLFFGLQFLKGASFFDKHNIYYVAFTQAAGLSESSAVYVAGYKVGQVKQLAFDYETGSGLVATIGLDERMTLPKGTKAQIASDMLGNVKLNLIIDNAQADKLAPGDTIDGTTASGTIDKVSAMLPAVEQLLPKLDSILASVNALLADPALSHSLHNVEGITQNLNTTTRELNTLMAHLNGSVPEITGKANNVLDNTEQITKKLSDIDVAATMAKVDATLANVKQMTDKLNSNEGTLGLLMRDPTLYNNLNATMRSADSLLIDLKAHPKRYVHFSVFGRKDK